MYRIACVDPGYRNLGWGVFEIRETSVQFVDGGVEDIGPGYGKDAVAITRAVCDLAVALQMFVDIKTLVIEDQNIGPRTRPINVALQCTLVLEACRQNKEIDIVVLPSQSKFREFKLPRLKGGGRPSRKLQSIQLCHDLLEANNSGERAKIVFDRLPGDRHEHLADAISLMFVHLRTLRPQGSGWKLQSRRRRTLSSSCPSAPQQPGAFAFSSASAWG